jgi:4-oxalmesaconate hydratase
MHTTGSYYLNADTMVMMQVILSDLFKQFPKLKFIIPHGGGAVPRGVIAIGVISPV